MKSILITLEVIVDQETVEGRAMMEVTDEKSNSVLLTISPYLIHVGISPKGYLEVLFIPPILEKSRYANKFVEVPLNQHQCAFFQDNPDVFFSGCEVALQKYDEFELQAFNPLESEFLLYEIVYGGNVMCTNLSIMMCVSCR